MNNFSSTIYKLVMVVVGCVIAYYLMTLATNSKKLVTDMAAQSQYRAEIKALGDKLSQLDMGISSVKKDMKVQAEKFVVQQSRSEKNAADLAQYNKKIAVMVSNSSSVNKNGFDFSSLESRVKKLENNIGTSGGGDIETVQAALQEMQSELAKIKKNAGDSSVAVKGEVDKMAVANIKVKSQLVAAVADIEKLKSEIPAAVKDEVDRIAAANTKVNNRLDAVVADIGKLKTQVSAEQVIGKVIQDNSVKNGGNLVESLQKALDGMVDISKITAENLQNKYMTLAQSSSEAIAELKAEIMALQAKITSVTVTTNNNVTSTVQQSIESLNDKFESYKQLSAKTLSNVEKSLDNVEKSNAQTILDTKKWLSSEIKALSEKSKGVGVNQVQVYNLVQKFNERCNVQIDLLKKEFNELQGKFEKMRLSSEDSSSSEPIGIVVNANFEKSLVLINTAKGSFVFNPYGNFTGIIRVRDADGAEKMLRVPYTGDYMKVSSGVLDSGPFSRNCAQGINCNLEVRGSLGSVFKAE